MTDQVRAQAQDLAERACYAHEATIRALDAEVQRLTEENARLWSMIDMLVRDATETGALLDRIIRRRAMGQIVGEAKQADNPAESA